MFFFCFFYRLSGKCVSSIYYNSKQGGITIQIRSIITIHVKCYYKSCHVLQYLRTKAALLELLDEQVELNYGSDSLKCVCMWVCVVCVCMSVCGCVERKEGDVIENSLEGTFKLEVTVMRGELFVTKSNHCCHVL